MASTAIAIVTMDRPEILRDTLERLQELDLDEKTLIIDGSEDDKTEEVCNSFDVDYYRQKSKGMTAARNEALERCEKDFIAYIDDDSLISDTWFESLKENFEKEDVVGVTGKLENEKQVFSGVSKKVRDLLFGSKENFGEILDNGVINGDFFYDEKKEVDHMPGCNMAYRVETLKNAGGFDENIDVGSSYREDTIGSYRAGKKGRLIYDPEASMNHLNLEEEGDAEKWMFYNPYLTRYFLRSENIISGISNHLDHSLVTLVRHCYFLGKSIASKDCLYAYYFYGELRGLLDFTLFNKAPKNYI